MLQNRRSFIKSSVLAGMALAVPEKSQLFSSPKPTIGLQLYSVREDMKQNPVATLEQLAKMGYHFLEHANYVDHKFYGFKPKEFRRILDDLGLVMRSGHVPMNGDAWDSSQKDFTDAWKKTIESAAVLGQTYFIDSWLDISLRRNFEDCKRFMEVFNKCGELCKQQGLKFGYHNHDFEFSLRLTSVRIYDIIMQYTDPSLVTQQLDLGNMYEGGGRAKELLKQYPNRFELLHVKDVIKKADGGYENTTLGGGIVGVKELLHLAAQSGGTTEYFVEQEQYQAKTPLQAVQEDLAWIKKVKL